MLFVSVHNATWHLQKCHDNWQTYPNISNVSILVWRWCDNRVMRHFFFFDIMMALYISSDVQSHPQHSHVVVIFHSCQDGATPNSTCLISLDQPSTESWASGVASAWQEMKSCSKTDTSLGRLDPWFCSSVYFWYVTHQELKSNSL